MEFNEEELDNVIAGTNQVVSEEKVLEHTDMFRQSQIEDLRRQREMLEELSKEQDKPNRRR